MKIAVVILNWNGTHLLKQFLPSVVKFSKEAAIYVIDNASSDESIIYLQTNFPEVTIINNLSNFGFAKGYNEGLKNVNEHYLALINSDVEVTENWLQPILSLFEKEENTAIVQPKILDYKNKSYFEYAGAAGGFMDKYGYPFCRGRIFETIEQDNGQYDDEMEIFWASGACFFIRNSVFKSLNGFDEDFFAHQEEIDLCWRAKNLGYIVKYTSKSKVFHLGGATLSKENPKKTFLNFRNSLWMLVKNLPKNQFIKIVFIRMILDGIAALRFLWKLDFKNFIAILKAHFYFYKYFLKFMQKRKKTATIKYFKSYSIVYQYYVLKKKHYKEIL